MSKIIFSKLSIAILIGLVAYVGFGASRVYYSRVKEAKELERLKKEITDLEGSNNELAEMIKYLQSPDYTEEEARKNLNLKKPGEHVVVIQPAIQEGVVASIDMAAGDGYNPARWFDYFFGEK